MKNIESHARALAALGHEARLSIFRLLVKAGPEGLRVSDIAEHLEMAPSTLAHHMTMLKEAKLVAQEKQGREVRSRVDFKVVWDTANFLTSECCAGVPMPDEKEMA